MSSNVGALLMENDVGNQMQATDTWTYGRRISYDVAISGELNLDGTGGFCVSCVFVSARGFNLNFDPF